MLFVHLGVLDAVIRNAKRRNARLLFLLCCCCHAYPWCREMYTSRVDRRGGKFEFERRAVELTAGHDLLDRGGVGVSNY